MFENPKTLRTILGEQVHARSDQTYLFFEDETVSYRDLWRRVCAIRAGLADAGVVKGNRVALLAPNIPEFLYSWFASGLLGAVTVPINPAFKPDEIRYILENSGAAAIVTTDDRTADVEAIAGALPDLRVRIVIDGAARPGWKDLGGFLSSSPPPLDPTGEDDAVTPEDPAAIIYTSGTTGHPKGVVLTHRNYHFDTWSLTTHLHATDADRFLCFLPLFHVNAQVVSVLSAAFVGGSLVLLREFKPGTFFESVARYRASTFSAVPTVYAILNTLPDVEKYDLSSLRYCVCGAAPMPIEVFNTFEKKFGATIVEGYGLSEATCGSCINPVGAGETRKIGSIGIPLPGQEMAIFDPEENALPDGDIGEIVVRGEAVMLEYFHNPDATTDTVRNRWLHTGDLGYRDKDGYYFIVGRKKEMIIRGGENIYPREIEEIIYRHPAVQEAAVIGVPDEIWGEEVCACIVRKPDAEVEGGEILELCRQNLADFKLPRRVEFLEEFPKTATGKIQKNKIVVG